VIRHWVMAISLAALLAALLAASRLVGDLLAPPHSQWWFTPIIALYVSLLTSAFWLARGSRGTR
jgi:hypothetical protein